MKRFYSKTKVAVTAVSNRVSSQFDQGILLVNEMVGGLRVIASSERSDSYQVEYDEKHYFVIPFKSSDTGFALHTMRCLPESALGVNDLPKRRVFHFPNKHYESALRDHLIRGAHELVIENTSTKIHTLESLANDIDALDNKLTYGMLIVGGLTAIINPLVGAGIAVKAVTPGAVGLINKYGLRPLGEKMSNSAAENAIKDAEKSVLKQFAESTTLKITNPILQELELALNTNQDQHDPLLHPNLSSGSIPELDGERWRDLTERALWHVYGEIYKDASMHKEACLGAEDIRWFYTLFVRFLK